LTPFARSANLIAGDRTKNGFSAPNKEPATNQKRLLDRKSPIQVWEANNPTVALKILERERPIDLLLVDHAMPEMTGPAVIERAHTYQPGLKTLLISGHADALRAAEISGVRALSKPFKVAELSKRIAEVLAGS
jgi:CheY-like chemotaxis protein